MSDDIILAVGGFIVVLVMGFALAYCGMISGEYTVMQQAFYRGYAVQCVGKKGYYWECDK